MKTEEKNIYAMRVTEKQKKKIQKVVKQLNTPTGDAIETVIDYYLKHKKTRSNELEEYINKFVIRISKKIEQSLNKDREKTIELITNNPNEMFSDEYLEKVKGIKMFKDLETESNK